MVRSRILPVLFDVLQGGMTQAFKMRTKNWTLQEHIKNTLNIYTKTTLCIFNEQKTLFISIININQSLLYTETKAVCSRIHKNHRNTLGGKKVDFAVAQN